MFVAEGPQAAGVVERRDRVVHRAGPGDDQQAVIGAVEYGADFGAGVLDGVRGSFGEGQLADRRSNLLLGDQGQ